MLLDIAKNCQWTIGQPDSKQFGWLSLTGLDLDIPMTCCKLQRNIGNAKEGSTLARKRSGKTLMISLESALLIGILSLIIFGSIARQIIRQQQAKAAKDGAVIDTVRSMLMTMTQISNSLNDHKTLSKEQHSALVSKVHDLGELTLDVEKRLTDQDKETRETIRELTRGGKSRTGTKIYNTNADGGQTNQGGSVHGEQR